MIEERILNVDRTQKLQNLLKSRQDRQNAQLLTELFATVETLEILGWVDEGEDWNGLAEKWNEITKISSCPLDRLARDRIPTDFSIWLAGVMNRCSLASPVYLQVSGFYCARWVQIGVENLTQAIAAILENSEFQEITVVDCTSKSILVFFIEEYYLEAHYRQ